MLLGVNHRDGWPVCFEMIYTFGSIGKSRSAGPEVISTSRWAKNNKNHDLCYLVFGALGI